MASDSSQTEQSDEVSPRELRAYERQQELEAFLDHYPYDENDPEGWYIGGYYVGYGNTGFKPDWYQYPTHRKLWEMGYADGQADAEREGYGD